MLLSLFSKLSAAISMVTYVAGASTPALSRSAQVCYSTETTDKLCYSAPNNRPQHLLVTDITRCAEHLRTYGTQTKAGRLFTMLTTDGDDCPEWSLYAYGSVLITAKHINSAVNSSVSFADIATTIDGGATATAAMQAAALIGCGTDGGSGGVLVNSTNPAYNATAYVGGGFTSDGILIKIVASGN